MARRARVEDVHRIAARHAARDRSSGTAGERGLPGRAASRSCSSATRGPTRSTPRPASGTTTSSSSGSPPRPTSRRWCRTRTRRSSPPRTSTGTRRCCCGPAGSARSTVDELAELVQDAWLVTRLPTPRRDLARRPVTCVGGRGVARQHTTPVQSIQTQNSSTAKPSAWATPLSCGAVKASPSRVPPIPPTSPSRKRPGEQAGEPTSPRRDTAARPRAGRRSCCSAGTRPRPAPHDCADPPLSRYQAAPAVTAYVAISRTTLAAIAGDGEVHDPLRPTGVRERGAETGHDQDPSEQDDAEPAGGPGPGVRCPRSGRDRRGRRVAPRGASTWAAMIATHSSR